MAIFKSKKKTPAEIKAEEIESLDQEKRRQVASLIERKLRELDPEIAERNVYMNKRDRLMYDSDYIVEDLDIKSGFDVTLYNFLPRAKEIHTYQVMGRGFNVVARYQKDDVSLYEKTSPQFQNAVIKNTMKSTQAANAKALLDGVVRDNGGQRIFINMAGVASTYGGGVIKKWIDPETDTVKVVSIESVQNYRAGWSSNNFRERDYDAIVYEISVDSANRLYGSKLPAGETFSPEETSILQDKPAETGITNRMVSVIDFVGRAPGVNDGEIFQALVVGGRLCGYETREKYMPKFYIFPNKERLRRPWGESDIADEAIDINKSYIQKMSDYTSLVNRILFPMIKAIGFEDYNMPVREQRAVQVFPMEAGQYMDILQFNAITYPYDRILNETKESLFRVLGLGRVLIDDPSINFNSNQALMTGMKSTIDIAEDKQTRWTQTMIELFNDILDDLKTIDPQLDKAIGEDYQIDIEWPSVLRKDDASYNTMLFNDVSRGLMSFETYLEKKGYSDVSEEIDRIKSEMSDEVLGAILSANLRMVNQVQLQNEMQQPQGNGGNANLDANGQPIQSGQPTGAPLTTDQNQPGNQPASAPGTGAPAVSPQGAAATMNQNLGR